MAFRPPRSLSRLGERTLEQVQHEIVQEKAATLSRLGDKLRRALAALEAFDAARPSGPARTDAEARERDELVTAAGEALWYFVVTREVGGLRDSEAVMREMRVPREVRRRMDTFPRPRPK